MLLALALMATAASTPADFKADFPGAQVVEAPSGLKLTNAFAFTASDLGKDPESAARAFLARYGAVFGLHERETLELMNAPAQGSPGAVRFERRIDGLPVFDADIVLGVDTNNAVILINAHEHGVTVSGKSKLTKTAAIHVAKDAMPKLISKDEPRLAQGWRSMGDVVRPVWRVDFVADAPPGDWRSYVDAENGKVLLRVNRRSPGPRAAK